MIKDIDHAIEVQTRRRKAGKKGRAAAVRRWARSRIVMIHEFSHALTDRTCEDPTGHGTHFCRHYINLVTELLGEETAKVLREAFDIFGVRYLK